MNLSMNIFKFSNKEFPCWAGTVHIDQNPNLTRMVRTTATAFCFYQIF